MVNGRSLESALATDHMNERDNLKRMRARMRTYDYINQKKYAQKIYIDTFREPIYL